MTQALFRNDAYKKTCETKVTEVNDGGIVLEQTVFYPQGGGQPGDSGLLQLANGETIRITDTRHSEGDKILHMTEPHRPLPVPGDKVSVELDWDRRYAHMRMHTCLHLLGAVLRYGVTGGAITADKSRLDFDMQDTVDKELVTQKVNALIKADHPVETRWITEDELDQQPELIRTMAVKPPRGVARIRLLEIPGVDLQPCGGTHVARTGEIGPVRIKKVEKKGAHNRRVHIVFG